jgi:hypothetical protein
MSLQANVNAYSRMGRPKLMMKAPGLVLISKTSFAWSQLCGSQESGVERETHGPRNS